MAVGGWLQMQGLNFYCDGIFKPVPRWGKGIKVLRDSVEKQ
jgi:hypothetical protein